MAENNKQQATIDAQVNAQGEVVETNPAPAPVATAAEEKKGFVENLKEGWNTKGKPFVKKVAIGVGGAAALALAFVAGKKMGEAVSDRRDQKYDPVSDPTLPALPEVTVPDEIPVEPASDVPADAPAGFEEI